MAKLRVEYVETVRHTLELDVPGYDGTDVEVHNAVADLLASTGRTIEDLAEDTIVVTTEVESVETLDPRDHAGVPNVRAPQYEPDW